MSLNEWKTEKAILEQKNELLLLQVQELKEREDNCKKFNDTILNAYNSLQSDVNKQNSKVYKEIQLTLEQYSKELIESKNKNCNTLLQLEQENRELKNTVQQLQNKLIRYEQQESDRYSFVDDRVDEQNKENIQQQEMSQQSAQSGCIVSLKNNGHLKKRSKTQLGQKPELSISNVLNCKNSNVMEINTDLWTDSQQSPNSINGLLRQFKKKNEDYSDCESPKYNNKQSLALQLKLLTKELKQTKNEIENSNDTASVNQLKHEIKFMINKLLKAKGQMTESIINDRSRRSAIIGSGQDRQTHKSLAEFTKQINAVKSIENFQMVLKSKALF